MCLCHVCLFLSFFVECLSSESQTMSLWRSFSCIILNFSGATHSRGCRTPRMEVTSNIQCFVQDVVVLADRKDVPGSMRVNMCVWFERISEFFLVNTDPSIEYFHQSRPMYEFSHLIVPLRHRAFNSVLLEAPRG